MDRVGNEVVAETATDKTKGDDYRHLAESATRDAKYKAAKDACVAYAEASKMQIIEHVMEVPQIQYQEVVRHVTVPQVVTQEVVRQVPVPQQFVQMVKQPYPVPQVMNSEKVSGSDRSSIPSFLSGGTSDGGRYGPQSTEIVGILKQLIDETSVDLQTLEKEELDQKTNHRSLMKAKTRETLEVKVEKMESEHFKAKRAPFVKVKGLITRLINRLQTEMSHIVLTAMKRRRWLQRRMILMPILRSTHPHLCPDLLLWTARSRRFNQS